MGLSQPVLTQVIYLKKLCVSFNVLSLFRNSYWVFNTGPRFHFALVLHHTKGATAALPALVCERHWLKEQRLLKKAVRV